MADRPASLAPLDLPALCRPAGWVALWRKIGAQSVLSCRGMAFS